MIFNIVSSVLLVAKEVIEILVYVIFNIKLLLMIFRPLFR